MAALFNITQIHPAVATTGGDTVVTLRGYGLDALLQLRYRSNNRQEARVFETQSATEATVVLPCTRLGLGLFTLSLLVTGEGTTEYNAHGDVSSGTNDPHDVRLMCFAPPRFDGIRPFVGPSWPGTSVRLTTTLHNTARCEDFPPEQKHICNPPPFNMLEQANPFSSSQLLPWSAQPHPRTKAARAPP